jgi:hypothetical protein
MRSAPNTKVALPRCSSSLKGVPSCATRAIHGRPASSNETNGTRKSAPIEARSAFGPVGSAQPSDRASNAGPSASAVRISVPTFPGSATCHSARPTSGRSSFGRSARRNTAITRGGCASVETSASRAGSTLSSATSSSNGSMPAESAASTRSSPSTKKSPSLSRQRRSCSLRTSLSFSLSREVIRLALRHRLAMPTIEVAWALPTQPSNARCW